jgi:hypothetical protein
MRYLGFLEVAIKDQVPNADLAHNTVLPKTNRISEADFSALDRVDRKAPQKCRSEE